MENINVIMRFAYPAAILSLILVSILIYLMEKRKRKILSTQLTLLKKLTTGSLDLMFKHLAESPLQALDDIYIANRLKLRLMNEIYDMESFLEVHSLVYGMKGEKGEKIKEIFLSACSAHSNRFLANMYCHTIIEHNSKNKKILDNLFMDMDQEKVVTIFLEARVDLQLYIEENVDDIIDSEYKEEFITELRRLTILSKRD